MNVLTDTLIIFADNVVGSGANLSLCRQVNSVNFDENRMTLGLEVI